MEQQLPCNQGSLLTATLLGQHIASFAFNLTGVQETQQGSDWQLAGRLQQGLQANDPSHCLIYALSCPALVPFAGLTLSSMLRQ